MVKKLFGETESEQLRYLVPRFVFLGIGVILLVLGLILCNLDVSIGSAIGYGGEMISLIALLVFGWAVMRGVFGYATVFALFSNNVAVGILIFMLFIFCGVYAGLIVALIGVCKLISLLINKNKQIN